MGSNLPGGLAWLHHGAPVDSVRPWAPIETSLPDPDLLPTTPPLYTRIPRLLHWFCNRPVEASIHVVAWSASMATITLSAVGALVAKQRACVAIMAALTISYAASVWALERRYTLYRYALTYQVHKSCTLASVTTDRLSFRRRRCFCTVAPAVATLLLFRSEPCFRIFYQQILAGIATTSVPAVVCVLYCFGTDTIEDTAIRRASHHRLPHSHTQS